MKLGSIPTGGNILLLVLFLFSRDSVEFYRMPFHLEKTQISMILCRSRSPYSVLTESRLRFFSVRASNFGNAASINAKKIGFQATWRKNMKL